MIKSAWQNVKEEAAKELASVKVTAYEREEIANEIEANRVKAAEIDKKIAELDAAFIDCEADSEEEANIRRQLRAAQKERADLIF